MKLEDYKTVLYRQRDGSWVAEISAIAGCYALMDTREAALAELSNVFGLFADEYREKGIACLPISKICILLSSRWTASAATKNPPFLWKTL
jgi:predicted RNase H-like HicB family nuclease